MKPIITVAITTRNRPESLEKVIDAFIASMTHDVEYNFVIVDDASSLMYTDKYNSGAMYLCGHKLFYYKFPTRVGIPAAKNKCLDMAKGDHIFLFDDDTYPVSQDWYKPYIESGINHLCYTFLPAYKEIGGFKLHSLGNGCMMYFTRNCLEKVGGFDGAFGLGKYEHVNLSRRIHNAGLTPHVFMDVIGSEKLMYCMDQKKEVSRSFSDIEAKHLLESGRAHFYNNLGSKEYIKYKK